MTPSSFSHKDLFSLINPILSNGTYAYRRLAGEAEHASEAWPHHPRHPRLVWHLSHEDLFSRINPILSNDTSVYRRLAGKAEHESEAWPHHPRHPSLVCRHELSKLSKFLHKLLELWTPSPACQGIPIGPPRLAVASSEYIVGVEIGICSLSWSVHHNFVREG